MGRLWLRRLRRWLRRWLRLHRWRRLQRLVYYTCRDKRGRGQPEPAFVSSRGSGAALAWGNTWRAVPRPCYVRPQTLNRCRHACSAKGARGLACPAVSSCHVAQTAHEVCCGAQLRESIDAPADGRQGDAPQRPLPIGVGWRADNALFRKLDTLLSATLGQPLQPTL